MTLLPTSPGNRKTFAFDFEVFSNYVCATFFDGERFQTFEHADFRRLKTAISKDGIALAGFNNFAYDDVLLGAICADPEISISEIKRLSDNLIADRDALSAEDDQARFMARYQKRPWGLSIDVFQLLNGKGSLKEHACRAGMREVEETPYDFEKPLPADMIAQVRNYCSVDVQNTANLLLAKWELVKLREHLDAEFNLGKRVYCLSEQGIAQATFLGLHRERTGDNSSAVRERASANPENRRPTFPFSEIVADNVVLHQIDILDKLMAGRLKRLDNRGTEWAIDAPDFTGLVDFDGKTYQFGVGGLHSLDGPARFEADAEWRIVDLDVTSYYPSIIVNLNLHPAQIDPAFVEDMRKIRDERVEAKRKGDMVTADALKIVVNSTFGKLNDFYSPLRSVPDALRVTINGQLYLLMLIERLAAAGIHTISANTDGVTVRVRRNASDALQSVVKAWEKDTGFELDAVDYVRVARRDVNAYVAVTDKGKVKTKGAFGNPKGDGRAISKAVVAWLAHRVPIRETFKTCKPEDFVFYQRCKAGGGGLFLDASEHLGRLARWVMVPPGTGRTLVRITAKQTATLPHGESVALTQDLNTIPEPDLDAYEAEAERIICSTMDPVPRVGPGVRSLL